MSTSNNPPSLPSPRTEFRNGSGSSTPPRASGPGLPPGGTSFLAMFLGAFAAVFLLALVGAGLYFGASALHSTGSSASAEKAKSPLENTALWQLGATSARPLTDHEKPTIGWWDKTFHLPPGDQVLAYLKKQGLDVSRIEPSGYTDSKDATLITYQVYAEVPAQLYRLQTIQWHPTDPDVALFAQIVVLNQGLPPGILWDTPNATVAAQAGTKLNFAWQIHYDKKYNTVTTDRLPFSDNVFTQQQLTQYQNESANIIAALMNRIQQIKTQVQADLQARLAQIPPNPPKPAPLSSKFGGDGSGEPTKSGERIGGGAAAGAAGGALFGAAAGNAGLGAGIGAGVGLLGGLIYDSVSKNNDKKKHEREVADENAERLDDWKAQIKSLNQQRAQAKQDAADEQQAAFNNLANQINGANGQLTLGNDANAFPHAPANAPSIQPTSNQPTGPVNQP